MTKHPEVKTNLPALPSCNLPNLVQMGKKNVNWQKHNNVFVSSEVALIIKSEAKNNKENEILKKMGPGW